MSKITLNWYAIHPTIYNDFLFQELNKVEEVDLTIYFLKEIKTSHPWKKGLNGQYKKAFLCNYCLFDLKHFYKAIFAPKTELYLLTGWNNINLILLGLILSVKKHPFLIWTDTPNTIKERKGIKQYLRKVLLNFLFKRTKYFLVTGHAGEKMAIKAGVSKEKVINFPFATDLKIFSPSYSVRDIDFNKIRFVSSGRIDFSHKGQDLALKALAKLKSKGIINFHYFIAGTGPDYSKLLKLIEEFEMKNFVTLVGWLEPEQMVQFYNSGDVLLHTSHFDPYPNAVLEAMACGIPVIGSNLAGSVADRVVQAENGYIHISGDIASIENCLFRILSHPERIKKMSIKSRNTAEEWDIEYHKKVLKSIVIS